MTNPTVQPVIHAIPIALSPTRFITFQRVTITPGVSLQRFVGPYARGIERQLKHFPENPEFAPTHLIVINQSKYYAALDQRLKLEGRALPRQELQHLDVNGITRQVLISTALVGRISWQIGGCHAINISNTSDQLRWSTPSGWFRAADGTSIQKVATSLDRYYRSGIWWNNRLSTALGYLWSALTTTHAELSFAALCMALEALATTANGEVTHILAERCALLSRQDGQARVQAYSDIKQLYALRSKIVHGRAGLLRGPMTTESLAISAKFSMVPHSKLFQLLAYVFDVILGTLKSKELILILNTKQSDSAESKAVDEYFQRVLLSKQA